MNTQHLQYIIEIERTRSISQAAENLYIGQPNLSRILHDMEDRVGFPIFERTSRGVHPTQRGMLFLRHAQNILREADQIENIGSARAESGQLRVCIPRSARCMGLVADYIAGLDASIPLDVSVTECHVRRTLSMLANADAEIGIVRYRREYQDYFREQAAQADMHFEPMRDFQYVVMMDERHPLADRETLREEQLAGYTQITHATNLRTGQESTAARRVHAVERKAQLSLLKRLPGAYLWIEELAPEKRQGFVQIRCEDNTQIYRDTLVYPKHGVLTGVETGLLEYLKAYNEAENAVDKGE